MHLTNFFPLLKDSFQKEKIQVYASFAEKVFAQFYDKRFLNSLFFSGIKNSLGVGFMIIQNIGDLLPKSFDAKIRYVNLRRETLKSSREIVLL